MLSQSLCQHVDQAVDSSTIGLHYDFSRTQHGLDDWAVYSCYQCTFSGTSDECKNHAATGSHNFFKSTLNYGILCVLCDDVVYPDGALSYSLKRKAEETLDDDIEWPGKRTCQRQGLRGMHNLGKTCYMNSMIQAILHNSLLASFFLGNGHPSYSCEVDDCIACSLTDTFESSWTSEDAVPYAPTKLLIASWKNGVIEPGDAQHDTHEYYLNLIDKLHSRTDHSSDGPCRCFIHQACYGSMHDILDCDSCKHRKISRVPICDLALDLPMAKQSNGTNSSKPGLDLLTCLQNFVAPERLEGPMSVKKGPGYTCSNCGKEGKATKKLSIKRLPPVLCIQLKRFRQVAYDSKKIEGHISFPLSLDMSPYTTKPSHSLVYELESVVVHESEKGKGDTETGHYFTFSRQGDAWYHFNDDKVTAATLEEVLKAQAYVLFYSMQGATRSREVKIAK